MNPAWAKNPKKPDDIASVNGAEASQSRKVGDFIDDMMRDVGRCSTRCHGSFATDLASGVKDTMNSKLRVAMSLFALAAAGALTSGCGDLPEEGVERATSALTITKLTLLNGWTRAAGPWPFPHNGLGDAGVTLVGGVVQFNGGMGGGTSSHLFTLPATYRPTSMVYLPVTLCDAKKGRLVIYPTGETYVYGETSFAAAQCMTSLEGVSFVKSTAGYTALPLVNGWTNAPFSTRNAAIKYLGGDARLVRLAGAIKTTGTNTQPFTIPLNMRPSTNVYLPVDMCNATKGRLLITPAGAVTVSAQGNVWSNAQCFTSLEGVSYSTTPASPGAFTCVGQLTGWTSAPYATRGLCLVDDGGIIRMMGAISTTGTNPTVLAFGHLFRPAHDMFMEVDMCNGEQGHVQIYPDGVMVVKAEHGFGQAACFTSFEGVSYVRAP
jgi:hypothetical protein